MKDFKSCTQKAYDYAMSKKDADVSTIPLNILYILYTKFKSDSIHLTDRKLAADAKQRKIKYWNELYRRKTEL